MSPSARAIVPSALAAKQNLQSGERSPISCRLAALQLRKLRDPPAVPLVRTVLGLQESAQEVERQLVADDLRPDAQHVGVVVLDALVGRVDVVAQCRPDPTKLVGGY